MLFCKNDFTLKNLSLYRRSSCGFGSATTCFFHSLYLTIGVYFVVVHQLHHTSLGSIAQAIASSYNAGVAARDRKSVV